MMEHFTSVVLIQNEVKKKQEEDRLEMIRLKKQRKEEKAKRIAAEVEAAARRLAEEEARRVAAESEAARQAERAEAAEREAGEARVEVARQAAEAVHAQSELASQLHTLRTNANQEKARRDEEIRRLHAQIETLSMRPPKRDCIIL